MKLSEYIKNLQEFMDHNGDIDCWYATDDEGNDYKCVYFETSFRYVDADRCMYENEEDLKESGVSLDEVTPVCIVN